VTVRGESLIVIAPRRFCHDNRSLSGQSLQNDSVVAHGDRDGNSSNDIDGVSTALEFEGESLKTKPRMQADGEFLPRLRAHQIPGIAAAAPAPATV
jgi:hypothetical protein